MNPGSHHLFVIPVISDRLIKSPNRQELEKKTKTKATSTHSNMGCQASTTSTSGFEDQPTTSPKDQGAVQCLALASTKLVVAGPAQWASDNISNKVALGAGCFWGTQKYIVKGTSYLSRHDADVLPWGFSLTHMTFL